MRSKFAPVTLLLLMISAVTFARPDATSMTSGGRPAPPSAPAQAQTVEELARAVADAFAASELGRLDRMRPYMGMVRIHVEHSISGAVENRSFRTLAQVEQWFRRGGRDPNRSSGTLRQCRRGVCTFAQEGMLHNTLYLRSITYGLRRGRPYVRAIRLIDGD